MATSRTSISFSRLAWAPLLLGCASESPGGPDSGCDFAPLAPDFAGYTSWQSFNLGSGGDAGAGEASCVHVANVERDAYLSKQPPHASTEFPCGTIIVKSIHTTPPQVLAMVKRGGGYGNGTEPGCVGWEWFGLDVSGMAPQIQWRGVAPPSSEAYASCGQCSSCHSGANNDCVLAPELQLSQW